MFKGLMQKTTYFKGQGRQEQVRNEMTPKGKGNKETKTYCKNFVTTEKISIFFPCGRCDWDRCHQVHVFMCTIDAITMHGILCPWPTSLARTFQNAIEKSSLQAVISKIKFSGKVYVFLDFLSGKFLIFRTNLFALLATALSVHLWFDVNLRHVELD